MQLPLDTHLLIWAAEGIEHVLAGARALLEAPENSLCFRVPRLWEIAIKHGLNRPDFQVDAHILRHGLIGKG